MPLSIRPAAIADAAVIAEFNYLLAEESEGKLLDREVLARGVTAVLSDPGKGLYFLAEDATGPLGQIGVTYEYSDWRAGWHWWIQSVYVRKEHRRRGVFRALYNHVCDRARQDASVIGLRLYVEKDNHGAQKTYKQLGMEEMSFVLMDRWPLR